MRRVAVGSDMAHDTVRAVVEHLESREIDVVRCGAAQQREAPWPEVAHRVARLVATRAVDSAVVCCWTGTGVSIAANKVPGVRAALCADAETARGARRWNDANVLALSLSTIAPDAARDILDAWLDVEQPDADELANIALITQLEHRYGMHG